MSKKNPWFRFYTEVLNDPKAQKLDPHIFKMWVNFLCVASDNNGVLPDIAELAYVTRCDENTVTEASRILIEADLLTVTKNQYGEVLSPKNWAKRQYKSDSSADRMRRHRANKKSVTSDVTVTPPETDTESEYIPPIVPQGGRDDLFSSSVEKQEPKKSTFDLPDWIDQQDWHDFEDMRKRKKRPMTERARQLVVKKLDELRGQGHDPAKVLQQSILHGWDGVFPLRDVQQHGRAGAGQSKHDQKPRPQVGDWDALIN